MSVFMGLPQITSGSTWDPVILPAYMALVERIIDDHAIRYDGEWFSKSFAGYYATDETDIGNPDSNLLAIYQMMSENAHKNGRQLLLSPWPISSRHEEILGNPDRSDKLVAGKMCSLQSTMKNTVDGRGAGPGTML